MKKNGLYGMFLSMLVLMGGCTKEEVESPSEVTTSQIESTTIVTTEEKAYTERQVETLTEDEERAEVLTALTTYKADNMEEQYKMLCEQISIVNKAVQELMVAERTTEWEEDLQKQVYTYQSLDIAREALQDILNKYQEVVEGNAEFFEDKDVAKLNLQDMCEQHTRYTEALEGLGNVYKELLSITTDSSRGIVEKEADYAEAFESLKANEEVFNSYVAEMEVAESTEGSTATE